MDNDIKFIRSIKPEFDANDYSKISSREKLVVYTMAYLEAHDIKLLFNYICIASFKLFPERFGFGEFKEYPHIEMLNRTILHLRPKENNYAEGSVRQEYRITKLGYHIVSEVKKQLKGELEIKQSRIVEIDVVKKSSSSDLKKILNNDLFKKWCNGESIEESEVWNYFQVTPYSRIEFIKKELKDAKAMSKMTSNDEVSKFVKYLEKRINQLM